jgi:hypothetical protein
VIRLLRTVNDAPLINYSWNVWQLVPMNHRNALLAALVLSPALAFADAPACPASITDAAIKVFPGSKVAKCKQGKDHFGVHLDKKDGTKAEVELSTKGDVVEVEDQVALTAVPTPVSKAFASRYPKLKVTKAAKITKTKTVTYELAAEVSKDNKTEATFKEDGSFVEDEAVVDASTLPATVSKAFAAKYPKAKATRVEKQTHADKTVTFEVAFEGDKGRVEATFKDDGSFVEEE